MTIFNDQGELITEGLDENDVKALQDLRGKAAEAESLRKQIDEEFKPKLDKLEKKDFDYSRLRNKKVAEWSEEERAKLSQEEQALFHRTEEIESQLSLLKSNSVSRAKEMANATLAPGDKNLQDKIEVHYKSLNDPDDTPEQVYAKMQKAHALATMNAASAPAFMSGISMAGAPHREESKSSFADTADGQKLAGMLGFASKKKS